MSADACTIGILFGDVAGSTRLYDSLGDAAAHEAIHGALTLMMDCVLRAGGVVVKTVGDEVMAAFFRPEPMIEAAIDMQRRMTKLEANRTGGKVKLRIGMHFGPALRSGADYFGQTVNTAARLVAIAKGDEIIAAADLRDAITGREQDMFRALETLRFKGFGDDLAIAEIVWHQTSQLTELPQIQKGGATTAGGRLLLECHGQKWAIEPRDPPFQIGRENGNTLCVANSRVSRQHATIERKITSWVLSDHSSNGSFVTFSGGRELVLRRQELVLHGSGIIAFGQPGSQANASLLKFSIFSG